jgi:hypothetical protein
MINLTMAKSAQPPWAENSMAAEQSPLAQTQSTHVSPYDLSKQSGASYLRGQHILRNLARPRYTMAIVLRGRWLHRKLTGQAADGIMIARPQNPAGVCTAAVQCHEEGAFVVVWAADVAEEIGALGAPRV